MFGRTFSEKRGDSDGDAAIFGWACYHHDCRGLPATGFLADDAADLVAAKAQRQAAKADVWSEQF